MTKLYEWQQQWDGSQQPVSDTERIKVCSRFSDLVNALVHIPSYVVVEESKRSFSTNTQHALGSLTLAAVQKSNSSYMLLDVSVPLAPEDRRYTQTARVASLYTPDESGVLIRSDFDTRPQRISILQANDNKNAEESPEELEKGVAELAKAWELEKELGFANQPVGLHEMESLEEFTAKVLRSLS